jgi:hypothetical protein
MNHDVPLIFQPRVLRKGVIFPDLSNHVFTIEEKTFLCGEMTHSNIFWKFHITSVKALSRRYKIHTDGLRLMLKLKE